MTLKEVIYVVALVHLLTVDEVLGSITVIGKATQNGSCGENITIVWKVIGLKASTFKIYVNTIYNEEDQIYQITVNQVTKSGALNARGNKEIAKRSSAAYNYLGKIDGSEIGEFVLHITNLTLHDEMIFILIDNVNEISRTNVYVKCGPEKCGIQLKPVYFVTATKNHNIKSSELNFNFGFCGKPQPYVTCSFRREELPVKVSSGGSQYNYKYDVNITTNFTEGEIRKFICTAVGHGNPVNFSTEVAVKYRPKKCGIPLKSEYFVKAVRKGAKNETGKGNIQIGFCGIPQPEVTCSLAGENFTAEVPSVNSPYNYTYDVNITTNLTVGERQNVTCTVVGYGDPVKVFTEVIGSFKPEKCGIPLRNNYFVGSVEGVKGKTGIVNLNMGFCGIPQPHVTCSFAGENFTAKVSSTGNYGNYTYDVKITTNLKLCETQNVTCTAVGYGDPVEVSTKVFGMLPSVSSHQDFLENKDYVEDKGTGCSTVTWEKAIETGNCDVCYQLFFLNSRRTITYTTNLITVKNFKDCKTKSKSKKVAILTYVADIGVCRKITKLTDSEFIRIIQNPTNLTRYYPLEDGRAIVVVSSDESKKRKEDGTNIGVLIGGVTGGAVVVFLGVSYVAKRTIDSSKNKNDNEEENREDNKEKTKSKPNNPDKRKNNKETIIPQQDSLDSVQDNSIQLNRIGITNNYDDLDGVAGPPQGDSASAPQNNSGLCSTVNEIENTQNHVIYSALGPGGGRVGPKPTPSESNYAVAKEIFTNCKTLPNSDGKRSNRNAVHADDK